MKRVIALLLAVAAVFAMGACGKPAEEPVEEATAEPAVEATKEPAAEPTEEPRPTPDAAAEDLDMGQHEQEDEDEDTVSVNPLTGETVQGNLADKRPLAVMLNNHEVAQPQCGVSQASIIYEIPVEGWITRMIAIFQDYESVEVFGSVRSARPYFARLADSYEAVYIHAGGSVDGMNVVHQRGIDEVDAVYYDGRYFYRDEWRKNNLGLEHSLMMNQDELQAAFNDFGFEKKHSEGYENPMVFAEDAVPEDGESANSVTVAFTDGGKKTYFDYHEESGLYGIRQYGADYVDGNTGEQVEVMNVVVLITDVHGYDEADHKAATLEGTGEAYLFIGGKAQKVTWSREDGKHQMEYLDENGEPVPFGIGHTYVCVISDERSSFTFE